MIPTCNRQNVKGKGTAICTCLWTKYVRDHIPVDTTHRFYVTKFLHTHRHTHGKHGQHALREKCLPTLFTGHLVPTKLEHLVLSVIYE